ncbi:thiosulfohydrolase SoxB [Kaarinaea lacus]
MAYSRREFLQLLAAAATTGLWSHNALSAQSRLSNPTGTSVNAGTNLYDIPVEGNVSLLHITDTHAQLMPAYYREPHVHLGFGNNQEQIPYLVGKHFLERFKIPHRTKKAYALTFLDFPELARRYGKTGGFSYLASLVKQVRSSRPGSLLLDGGDTFQGSATALWTNGQDMVDAIKLLGVDVMTGHWEFTYGMDRFNEILENDLKGNIDFVAQNVVDNEFEDPVFNPYVVKEINGVPVAIIGQAFPYTPIAHPKHLVQGWQFGIREDLLQLNIDKARSEGAQVVVLLSHNGMDVDLKLASRVTGIDFIFGGHTHDAIPDPVVITNRNGKTVVINSGTNGKFLSVLDLDVRKGRLQGYKYRLVPVFANLLQPDLEMQAYIESVRKPYEDRLKETLAITDDLLYRRGTFNGTFDQLILNALLKTQNAEIALSPGFRWGTTVLPGANITMEDVMAQTAITYPNVTRNEMSGERIKYVLEDLADNRFSRDPYRQQGGDMVRVGGLQYKLNPANKMGSRISSLTLNGKPVQANKKYIVAGWASVQDSENNTPVWDVVGDYLRDKKFILVDDVNQPMLPDLTGNMGYQAPTA